MSSFIAIDFETADYKRNSACAIGIVKVTDSEIVEKVSFLIRPPSSRFMFTHIHGIIWEDVRNQPTFSGVWPRIRHYFYDADFVVAHNMPFDKSVLKACCEEYGISMPDCDFRCTLKLCRQYLDLPSNSLDVVSEYLGFDLDHHQVMSDTVTCAKVMMWFMENFEV